MSEHNADKPDFYIRRDERHGHNHAVLAIRANNRLSPPAGKVLPGATDTDS
jgi:hypothetical protein